MKISNIKLINFRSHRMSEISFDKDINFVFGSNGSGKTSILEAISWALLGRNSRTDKRGAGSNRLITKGEGRSMVELEVDEVGKITRSIPHSLEVEGVEGNKTEKQNAILEGIGISEDKIYSALNSSEFLDLKSKEKKAFLFDMTDLKITTSNIRNEFINWCKENSVENGGEIFDKYVNVEIKSTEKIDSINESMVSKRRKIKRDIKSCKELLKEEDKNLPEGYTVESEDKLREEISDLENEERELIKDKSNYVAEKKKLDEILNSDVAKEDIDDLEDKKDKYEKLLNNLRDKRVELKGDISSVSRIYNTLKNWKGECPILPKELNIDCPISSDDLEKPKKSYKKKNDKLKTKIDKIEKRISNGSKMIKEVKSKIKESRNKVSKKDKEEAKSKLNKLNNQYDKSEIEKGLKTIKNELKKKRNLLTKVLAAKNREKEKRKKAEKLERLEKELEEVKIMADAFSPNGIKSLILYKLLEPIREKAQERMQGLTRGEYEMDIRMVEDDLKVFLGKNNMEVEYQDLSSSEKLMCQIVVQDIINGMTGLDFLIVDNVDTLDKENRKSFYNLLRSISDEYDMIISLCTGEAFNMDEDVNTISLN